jgi:hypothetical protein
VLEGAPFNPSSLRTRTSCRICGSTQLAPVIDLGDQCIAGAFADPGGSDPVKRLVPLELVRCDMTADQDACGLVQTRHTVPGSILYRSYWYRSGVNRTMTENLHGIARQAEDLAGLEEGDLVVDIGCNDGTLLDGYEAQGIDHLGFDPSDVSRYAVEKGYEVINDFFARGPLAERYPDRKAKVITSIAMFYDLEDPGAFVRDVAESLAEDGIWGMELHYLPLMLERNSFDAIVHEHLEYYSLAVLERLFAAAGMEVIAASVNDVNGGSIRLMIGHRGQREPRPEHLASIQDLRLREFELALDSPEPYAEFAAGSEAVRDELSHLCRSLTAEGKSIHAYGASTKGNTILQYAGLDSEVIACAADRNEDKWGSRTIRTNIPIVSEEESRSMSPDYYLVLPWHFLDEFLERESEFLKAGGRFIVPLPQVHIVGPGGIEDT